MRRKADIRHFEAETNTNWLRSWTRKTLASCAALTHGGPILTGLRLIKIHMCHHVATVGWPVTGSRQYETDQVSFQISHDDIEGI